MYMIALLLEMNHCLKSNYQYCWDTRWSVKMKCSFLRVAFRGHYCNSHVVMRRQVQPKKWYCGKFHSISIRGDEHRF